MSNNKELWQVKLSDWKPKKKELKLSDEELKIIREFLEDYLVEHDVAYYRPQYLKDIVALHDKIADKLGYFEHDEFWSNQSKEKGKL